MYPFHISLRQLGKQWRGSNLIIGLLKPLRQLAQLRLTLLIVVTVVGYPVNKEERQYLHRQPLLL